MPSNEKRGFPAVFRGLSRRLTIPSASNDIIQGSHQVGKDGIGVIEAGEHGEDIGARIGVLLAQHGA